MNCQPPEVRIITALVLQPMASTELCVCLDLPKANTHHRIAFLKLAGFVRIHSHIQAIPKRRSAIRYTLTIKGRQWAKEIMS